MDACMAVVLWYSNSFKEVLQEWNALRVLVFLPSSSVLPSLFFLHCGKLRENCIAAAAAAALGRREEMSSAYSRAWQNGSTRGLQ